MKENLKTLNYSLQSKVEESDKKRKQTQSECVHAMWSTRCAICGKYLASDVHINYHTKKGFITNNKVAIIRVNTPVKDTVETTLYRIQTFSKIKDELGFTEITILCKSVEDLELFSALKVVDRAVIKSLEQEVKLMRKYRSKDVVEITLLSLEPADDLEALTTQCKSLKINTKQI